jgi:hypothetical protein
VQDKQGTPRKGQPEPPAPTEVRCVVMDGQAIAPEQFKALEDIPTMDELLVMVARAIKANPTKIALGLKAIPRSIAYGMRALSELNDDKTMTVEAAAAAAKEGGGAAGDS